MLSINFLLSSLVSGLCITTANKIPNCTWVGHCFNDTCITNDDCDSYMVCGGSGNRCSTCGSQFGYNKGCGGSQLVCGNCEIGLGYVSVGASYCLNNCA